MLGWLRNLVAGPPWDEAHRQAWADQANADYPGCKMGYLKCRAMCDCTVTQTPLPRWIAARAKALRLRRDCPHAVTRSNVDVWFRREDGSACVRCGMVTRDSGHTWEDPEQ